MNTTNSSLFRQLLPHAIAVAIFLLLTVIYFKPTFFDGKTLQQSDITQWRGAAQELIEYATNDPGARSAWTGSMFAGMPSYNITVVGGPPNYLGYVQMPLALNHFDSAGAVFAGLICAYIFFFLLTGNFWIALIGAIACALSSYNLIILQAGHVTKAWAIAYMPLVLSGMLLIFRKKYIVGLGVMALALAMQLISNHIQITYYFAILCLIIYLAYLAHSILKKQYGAILKTTLTMFVAVVLAVLPKLPGLYSDLLMSRESLRGQSELTSANPDENTKTSDGLDINYAFTWSYGKSETLSLLIPNIYGGESGGTLGQESNLYKELKSQGQSLGKEIQTYTYWGDKPFTSGPVYVGATICFLFVLGMFVIRSKVKWWLFGAAVLFVLLAWGKNLAWFNDWLFYNLPMYNKFRTPEMSLVIPALILPIIGCWGLKSLVQQEQDAAKLKNQFIYSLAITGGICLILWLMPGLFFNFESEYDGGFIAQMQQSLVNQGVKLESAKQFVSQYYSALIADRESLLKSDALRSLTLIILTFSALFVFLKHKKYTNFVMIAIVVLVLFDLWSVDKRYLNDSNFENKKPEQTFTPSTADNIILQDKSPSYRVLNLSVNPFQDASTSYFHKSIGGYSAAKLRRYQELTDAMIQPEIERIIGVLSKVRSMDDLNAILINTSAIFINTPAINMLNGKYIIYNPAAAPIENTEAFGNAWFVSDLQIVENADAELASLNSLNPKTSAVVDKRFENLIGAKSFARDSSAVITLTEYHPDRLVYHSKTSAEQLAVFSEIYFADGWKAFIDGQPAPHFRADWILRAMYVPAGEHTIEFRFEPDTYNRLANISSWTSLLLVLIFVGAVGYSFIRPPRVSIKE